MCTNCVAVALKVREKRILEFDWADSNNDLNLRLTQEQNCWLCHGVAYLFPLKQDRLSNSVRFNGLHTYVCVENCSYILQMS